VVLLERGRELAMVGRRLSGGAVFVVEGGAGIGKTSLLDAVCARARDTGCAVLRARGSELETAFAFGVVRQLFERRVAGADANERQELLAGPAAALRPLLRFGKPFEAAAGDMSFVVLHGLYWLAVNLASICPLVIVVDDVHWADQPSRRWLAYLAPRVEGLAVSLLVALRPTEPASGEVPLLALRAEAEAVVRLRPLSAGAVAAIVRDTVGEASDELCIAVARASGGNPLYVRELLRVVEVEDCPLAELDPAQLLARAGEGIALHVEARIRRLDPGARRLAQALAVLGDGCELRHAASVADLEMEAAARMASGLVRAEVLAQDEPPRFLHPIVREAVEASLASDERDSAHRAAAHLLSVDRAAPGEVAAHLMCVRPAGDPWVVARLREAARVAIDRGAPQAGAELLVRALAEPPSSAERVQVLREAGSAEALAGSEVACARLEEARSLAVDPRERAAIAVELAEAYASVFRWGDAVDVSERALAELGEADQALAARLEGALVVAGLRDARRASQVPPVLERLSSRPLEGAAAEAYAVARAMEALWMSGKSAEEIAPSLQTALARAGPRAENWDVRAPGLWVLIHTEGFDAVGEVLEGMRAEVHRSGSVRGLFVTFVTLGLLKLRLGTLPEADAATRVGLHVAQAADLAHGLPLVATVLAEIAIEAGQLDEAQALLELPPGVRTVWIPAARGHLRLAQDRPEEALAEFEACRALLSADVWGLEMRDNGYVHARSGAAQALLRLGERERACEMAQAELADARAFAAPRALGIALRATGLARGGEQGLELLAESTAVLRSSPALLERAHSLAELGAALRRAGQRAAAREPLAEALDLAARCGARPLAARAREELQATGARPRREWRTGVEALTPSELRVARLAAEGKTNREIAHALYVTPKTVEGHLARAYGKLEITGRTELAQALEGEKTRVASR
jgi:DNA-binding CsgD family transcriptional regulator